MGVGASSKKFANGLTPLQEGFAVEYLKCNGNASEAFRRANPRSRQWKPNAVESRASIMLANAKVKQRIEELQAKTAKRHEVTVDSLAKELDAAAELAREIKQPGVVVSAVQVKARMYGLIVEKKEIRHGTLDDVPVEDVKAMADAVSAFRVRGEIAGDESVSPREIRH